MLWLNKHAPYRNNLSPYVDGLLRPAETAALEAHLAACEPCRHELEQLRATVAAVRDLPQLETPRSFAVTPQMLEQRRAVAPLPSAPRLALGMRMASAAVAVVLAVVVIGDVSDTGGGRRDELETASGPAAESRMGEFAAEGDAEIQATAPDATTEEYDTSAENSDKAAQATAAAPLAGLGSGCPVDSVEGPVSGAGIDAPATPAVTSAPEPALPDTPEPSASAGKVTTDIACVERSGEVDATVAPGAIQALRDAGEGVADEASPSAAGTDDDGISTLRVIEIILAGSLTVLLFGVAADLVLRRRRSI